jgi:hypothetical protein
MVVPAAGGPLTPEYYLSIDYCSIVYCTHFGLHILAYVSSIILFKYLKIFGACGGQPPAKVQI